MVGGLANELLFHPCLGGPNSFITMAPVSPFFPSLDAAVLKGHKGQNGESKNKQFRVYNAGIPDSPTCTWTGKKRRAGQNRVHPPAVRVNQPGGIQQNREQKPAPPSSSTPPPLFHRVVHGATALC